MSKRTLASSRDASGANLIRAHGFQGGNGLGPGHASFRYGKRSKLHCSHADNEHVDLASKLQIKPGTVVAAVAVPANGPDLSGLGPGGEPGQAGAVVAFAHSSGELSGPVQPAIDAARHDKLAWIAYPKAGQLGTDLNRDVLAAALAGHGIRPVRQVALDEVWSALRFRPA